MSKFCSNPFSLKISFAINVPFAPASLKKLFASLIRPAAMSTPTVWHPIREKGNRLPPSPHPISSTLVFSPTVCRLRIYGMKYSLLVMESSLKYVARSLCRFCIQLPFNDYIDKSGFSTKDCMNKRIFFYHDSRIPMGKVTFRGFSVLIVLMPSPGLK